MERKCGKKDVRLDSSSVSTALKLRHLSNDALMIPMCYYGLCRNYMVELSVCVSDDGNGQRYHT